ncbi:unnamed protein product, partial [Adineta steineri]
MIQFSIWLSSPNLVGSQAIVFAISGASTSGIIQLPAVSIGSCATQSFSTGCTSYIISAQANGTQSTSYTVTPSSSNFTDPCLSSVSFNTTTPITTTSIAATNNGYPF